jgi:hypothetical protein
MGPRCPTICRPGCLTSSFIAHACFFYEWVEGVFTASADTVEGELRHEKLETRADPQHEKLDEDLPRVTP